MKNSKKNRKENYVSLNETWQKNCWAFRQWSSRYPMMFITNAMNEIAGALIPYVGIYLSAQIINELAGERRSDKLQKLVLITLIVTFLLGLIKEVMNRWHNYYNAGHYYKRCKIYADKMLDMDFYRLDESSTHDLRSQIMQNERWQGWGLNNVIWTFSILIRSIVQIIGAVVLTVSLFAIPVPEESGKFCVLNSPLFVVAIGAVMLLVTFLSPLCSAKANGYWTKQSDDSKMGNRFFSFYGFMANEHYRALDIRIYRQDRICDYYWKSNQTFTPKSVIAKYARGPMGGYQILASTISVIFTGIVYVFVCAKAWAGAFGVGSVTQYIGAISSLSQGIGELVRTIGQMRTNAFFLRKTYDYLNMPNLMYQGSLTTEKRSDKNYEVEFRNVSFRYPTSENYVLRHINMKFKVGERLAVVGQNGSGKTTFIKLLCRMYDPTEGVILLNGIDIRKYDYKDYMSIFAVVFQDFKLMAFPLGQNVATSSCYDNDKVISCLKEAGFENRLKDLPNGLETYLYRGFDEEGVEISGGEAQKIALARALYKDAPFIILDEPTAALDPIAEYEVYLRFNEIVKDKTAIYISHRLSSCRFCDDILVFDQGQIVQHGTHEKLVTDINGKYYKLWNAQAQYYTESV